MTGWPSRLRRGLGAAIAVVVLVGCGAGSWAGAGWISINVSYRLGVLDSIPGDGRQILADVLTVLATYRARPYVDPARIVVYGESAGGHLATWLGSFKGDQIAATATCTWPGPGTCSSRSAPTSG